MTPARHGAASILVGFGVVVIFMRLNVTREGVDVWAELVEIVCQELACKPLIG
jgi:hypothetical protein